MSWTAPRTWVAGELVTAALMNSALRDNMLLTAPAVATTATGYFVATAANAVAERIPSVDSDATTRTSTSATYETLTGAPSISVTTGTKALAWWAGQMRNSDANVDNFMSCAVSGATTTASDDDWAFMHETEAAKFVRASSFNMFTLTAGTNVFTVQVRVQSGTMTILNQRLAVFPL